MALSTRQFIARGEFGRNAQIAASRPGRVGTMESGYAILNSRKRALIALVHTVFFLLLAMWQSIGAPKSASLLMAPRRERDRWRDRLLHRDVGAGVAAGDIGDSARENVLRPVRCERGDGAGA